MQGLGQGVRTEDMVNLSIAAMRTAVESGELDRERQTRAKLWLLTFDKAIKEGQPRSTAIERASAESGIKTFDC